MSAYPPHRFVQEFSRRTRHNLLDMKHGRPVRQTDTALISSLLAVFVLPHERADDATFMAALLSGYDKHPLDKIVTVIRSVAGKDIPTEADGVPKSIGEIPRFLRHAVAHMNVRPQSLDGMSLTHLLVWNKHPSSRKITFVASVHVRRLRSLAVHILEQMSISDLGDKYEGFDPIVKFDSDHSDLAKNGV